MNDDNSLAFTDEIISAWQETVRMAKEEILAEPTGSKSTRGMADRINVFRKALCNSATELLQTIPAYRGLGN
ncbi:MAG TPA: hypothetical protein PKW95_14990 [bacterium]|nr:hypothetical protein [bacterium]